MKIIHSFLLFIIITTISVNLTAMELNLVFMEQEPDDEVVFFTCLDADDDLIAVPKKIIRHSAILTRRVELLEYNLPFNSAIVCAVVDCLTIIDSKNDIANLLFDYIRNFMAKPKSTDGERDDLCSVAKRLKIQPMCDSFDRIKRKNELAESNQKLDEVLQQAKTVFEKIENKNESAIIFDVDDTALTRSQEINGASIDRSYFKALPQVYALYKNIVDWRFKIFFLTARAYSSYEKTASNLINEGYTVFEEIICAPDETRDQIYDQAEGNMQVETSLLAEWKERERNKIAERFTIVGTLDDIIENLQGENVGHAALIPKFF